MNPTHPTDQLPDDGPLLTPDAYAFVSASLLLDSICRDERPAEMTALLCAVGSLVEHAAIGCPTAAAAVLLLGDGVAAALPMFGSCHD